MDEFDSLKQVIRRTHSICGRPADAWAARKSDDHQRGMVVLDGEYHPFVWVEWVIPAHTPRAGSTPWITETG